jgi:hypothetical protein
MLARVCKEYKGRLAAVPGVVPQLVSLLTPGCGEALQAAALRLLLLLAGNHHIA